MDKENKNLNFKVTGSKLVYSNKKEVNIFTIIAIVVFTAISIIVVMSGIGYGLIKLFKLTVCNLDQKISYCSAIITFACAVITVSTLLADRQIKIYDDSLNIFNELNSKYLGTQSSDKEQQNRENEAPLHRWYFIKKFKTYFLKDKKKMYSHISDAVITFYIKNSQTHNTNDSLELKIPLTTAEWKFFNVAINCIRMLSCQKYYLFNFYSTDNKNALLMWETVLSLYKSVMVNKIMNAIRLISILIIPAVIIIACVV